VELHFFITAVCNGNEELCNIVLGTCAYDS